MYGLNVNMESGTADTITPIDFTSINFDDYIISCPLNFGPELISSSDLLSDVVNGNKLLRYPLKYITDMYYPDSKLNIFSSHRHDVEDESKTEVTAYNCSFFIVIGNNNAINVKLHTTKSSKKESMPADLIYISKPILPQPKKDQLPPKVYPHNIQFVLAYYYNQMFTADAIDDIYDSLNKTDIVNILILGRSVEMSTKGKKNVCHYKDQIIAAASITIDNYSSLLLSWVGVPDKKLTEMNIHKSFTKSSMALRKKFNLGRFMLIICQIFKSVLQSKWCPIICQVHKDPSEGPLKFYLKNYFMIVPQSYQLAYDQLIFRKKSMIHDDPHLIWMVLFYPLVALYQTDIIGKSTSISFQKIIVRGYFYFLKQLNVGFVDPSFTGDEIENKFVKNQLTISIKKPDVEPKYEFTDDDDKQFIHATDDEMNVAVSTVSPIASFVDCGFGPGPDDGDCLFLSLSKLLYGKTSYYYSIRQFLYYYHRNVSLLSIHHSFYKDDDNQLLLMDIAERVYGDKEPADIYNDDKKPKLLRQISSKYLEHSFWGSFADLLIVSSLLRRNIFILDGQSPTIEPSNNRTWTFSLNSTYGGQAFLNRYLSVTDHSTIGSYWLVRVSGSHFMPVLSFNDQVDIYTEMLLPDSFGTLHEETINTTDLMSPEKTQPSVIDNIQDLQVKVTKRSLKNQFNEWINSDKDYKLIKKNKFRLDGIEISLGPMFSLRDFEMAGVPELMIMPCVRCLDPLRVLAEANVWAIENECYFVDLIKLRRETWLGETTTKVFIEWMNKNSTPDTVFLDPCSFNSAIIRHASLRRFIVAKKLIDADLIVMLFHITGHFVVIEIFKKKFQIIKPSK
jgi:hypothetical protein